MCFLVRMFQGFIQEEVGLSSGVILRKLFKTLLEGFEHIHFTYLCLMEFKIRSLGLIGDGGSFSGYYRVKFVLL